MFQASAAVITDLFKTGASTLLEETRAVQARKLEAMQRLEGKLRGKLEAAEPITEQDLQSFLTALAK